MSTSPQGFIAAAPPSRIVRAPTTTLFDLAARFYGDQRQWTVIAAANSPLGGPFIDPWLTGAIDIKIPNLVSTVPPTGILGI
jgi:nucleoid-associated protein YgaU